MTDEALAARRAYSGRRHITTISGDSGMLLLVYMHASLLELSVLRPVDGQTDSFLMIPLFFFRTFGA